MILSINNIHKLITLLPPSIESDDVSGLNQAAHLVPHWYGDTSGPVSYFTWTHFVSILCLRHSTWYILLKKHKYWTHLNCNWLGQLAFKIIFFPDVM